MPRDTRINRRKFLKRTGQVTAAAVALPYFVPASSLGKAGQAAPSNRLIVGCIGTGGQGRYDMGGFLASADAQVVAVCDVKREARDAARDQVNGHYKTQDCKTYNDFRELVAREDIDVVQVASTDQWHVLHALAAVRAGKHVYVEKPLGMSIEELKTLRTDCHRYERVFQFGTQQRSSPQFRQACELVLNGRIGKLQTIKVSAPVGAKERSGDAAYAEVPVPDGFDYDMWLGPAAWAPYTPKRTVSPYWFHISDYSLGYVAGWGIHHIDIAQWGSGMQLTGPVEIEGSGLFPGDDALCDNPINWDVDYLYPNGVRVNFTSDGRQNRHGILFEGSEGWVYVNREVIEANPKSLLQEKIKDDGIHLPVSTQHQQDLLNAIKSGGQPVSPIDVAVRSDTVCHLSHIAMHLGRKLRWDPAKEEFIDDPVANARLKRSMRTPWHL